MIFGSMSGRSQGILIVVEGIDGAGKTTQVRRISEALRAVGENVVVSKEPTDGRWGSILRSSAQNGRMSLERELELFLLDRREHMETKVLPALRDGNVVLLDRYYYSTIAYQGSRGADARSLEADMRSEFPAPDAVLLIDVLPAIGLDRVANSRGDEPNHFERVEPLTAVRQIFNEIAGRDPLVHVINGHNSMDEVFADCSHVLIDSALRSKRCAKSYGCDIFNCAFRATGECQWWEIRGKLNGIASQAQVAS